MDSEISDKTRKDVRSNDSTLHVTFNFTQIQSSGPNAAMPTKGINLLNKYVSKGFSCFVVVGGMYANGMLNMNSPNI